MERTPKSQAVPTDEKNATVSSPSIASKHRQNSDKLDKSPVTSSDGDPTVALWATADQLLPTGSAQMTNSLA